MDEIDALVTTPFYIVVVEVKNYKYSVEFGEQGHLVNGEKRQNPIDANEYKAKRLKGKLSKADPQIFKNIYVSDQVVLAQEPELLKVHPLVEHKVVRLEEAV